jgi:CRISPR-associated protein Cmr1
MKKDFTRIEATYRITTPMFCGGADQDFAELRLPSFKGALRFWWRSLMWNKVNEEKKLRKREAELFGSSDQGIGQSKVKMQLIQEELQTPFMKDDIWAGGELNGAYYLGYGVVEAFGSRRKGTKSGQLIRPMIPGGQFTVRLKLGPKVEKEQQDEVQNALILLGTVGGLGSRSRKGFGSLTLTELFIDDKSIELNPDPGVRIQEIFTELNAMQPKWTAWSDKSRLLTVECNSHAGGANALDLLDELGREQVHFRSWGNRRPDGEMHTVLGKKSEKNFPEDHDLSKGKPVRIKHPKRIVFGLPHSYMTGKVEPDNKNLNRRASPLFIHIHQIDENSQPVGVVTFLPSLFLPKGEMIKSFNKTVLLDTSDNFWEPIHGYLNRLMGKGKTKKKDNTKLLDAKEVKLV